MPADTLSEFTQLRADRVLTRNCQSPRRTDTNRGIISGRGAEATAGMRVTESWPIADAAYNKDVHASFKRSSQCTGLESVAGSSAGCRRRAVADWRQVVGPGRFDGLDIAGWTHVSELVSRVSEGVKELELGAVVVGDGREIFVVCHEQQLERVDSFLRPVDENQDVAEASRLAQALVVAIEGDDAGAECAMGLADACRGGLEACVGGGDFGHDPVLRVEELDDCIRLLSALGFDSGKVADAEGVELPDELEAYVRAAGPLIHAAIGSEPEYPGLKVHSGGLKAVKDQDRKERANLLARCGSVRPERERGWRQARGGW